MLKSTTPRRFQNGGKEKAVKIAFRLVPEKAREVSFGSCSSLSSSEKKKKSHSLKVSGIKKNQRQIL